MALPFNSHPLYTLRKASVAVAMIGIVLSALSIPFYGGECCVALLLFLIVLICFSVADLYSYAGKKLQHPDDDPKWPLRTWMAGDLIFAILLQWVFWIALAVLSFDSYYGTNIGGLYAALAALICSLLHAWCFWKQLMARYRNRWLQSLTKQQCARCGYSESDLAVGPSPSAVTQQASNNRTYVGPSADFRQANVLTPESAMEEGLLIGTDGSSGYGCMEAPEPIIEQPDEVIVGKGKKKACASDRLPKHSQA